MSNDHGRFIWYELMSPDVEAAKRFYGDVVGWTAQAMPMPGGDYTILNADGAGVAGAMPLTGEQTSQGMPPHWIGYVYVDDCDAAAEKARSLGGAIHHPPTDIPTVGRFAVIADPHGAAIAIMRPEPPPGARPEIPKGTPGSGGWHELYAGDPAKDIPFYQQLFGWTETDRFDMGPMGIYHLFGNADGQVGGMMQKPDQIPMACWVYYFESPDVDAAAARITAAGGTIMMGPMDVPDGSRVVQGVDPQGAVFALVKTRL